MSKVLDIDLYQATMLRAYFHAGKHEEIGAMEVFARKLPDSRNFFVVVGLARILDYLDSLKFDYRDIEILTSIPGLQIDPNNIKDYRFIDYLKTIKFREQITVWAMLEGTVAFPYEPLLRLEGPIALLQYVEKHILSIINHDVRIASKAIRIVNAARGIPVYDFGGRRAHEETSPDVARAAYIAGFAGTSNVAAFAEYGVPVAGTMGHVWVMSHDSEKEAFENWNKAFRKSTYLIDTYDVNNGFLNALEASEDIGAIRLDSGDMVSQSIKFHGDICNKKAQIKIMASNDLNEYKIDDMLRSGAKIDMFGVGTELVATPDSPSLGFVYKLVARKIGNDWVPVHKNSEGKATYGGRKQVYRKEKRDLVSTTNPEESGLLFKISDCYEFDLNNCRIRVNDQLNNLPNNLLELDKVNYEVVVGE